MRLLLVSLLLAASAARAQAPDTVVATIGSNGLVLRAGDASVSLGALVQADARFYASEGDLGTDQFLLRRARFFIRGQVGPVAFRVVPDFGQGRVDLDEAWGEVPLYGPLSVRAGYFKPQVALERNLSSSAIPFVERALPTALVPDTEVGVMLLSNLGSRAELSMGVSNGVPDGQTGQGDLGDGKDVAARIAGRPFGGVLDGLTLGVGGTYGTDNGSAGAPALPRYRTTGGRQIAAYIAGDSAAVAAGARARLVPHASFVLGPVSAIAEWALSSQRVSRSGETVALRTRAWQLAVAAVLTGERATMGRLRPARPVGEGGVGAFELAARVHGLTLDEDAFPLFVDPAAGARSATAVALGLNWYLTDIARVSVTGERTSLGAVEGFEDPPAENVLFGRLQVAL
jgi:phosphate-selective porin OprO/OprP